MVIYRGIKNLKQRENNQKKNSKKKIKSQMAETTKGHLITNHQYKISLTDEDAKSNRFITTELFDKKLQNVERKLQNIEHNLGLVDSKLGFFKEEFDALVK